MVGTYIIMMIPEDIRWWFRTKSYGARQVNGATSVHM